MLKTYLYIPEELDRQIKNTAKAQNKSKAEILRLALEKGIETLGQKGSATSLLMLAEIGKKGNFKGPKDSSQRIDELLWGKDWSK
ncbi:MAG: hypothetical protein A3F61_01615 [Candidatus Blackburnbacteria bacterium RIFCSPHIGHO2_12_FULL_41_13b]|uniref:Ribbon-helix-helix protein CopG domain-containing protein n=1 Tax=Candidatus Blackburnbacteria bacterium RIFCSPHIGHO2_12_FULL_41_13b TaxID=1797517 RepID=A0A1G1VCI1_9BACT|nr:MAG: hypothetical protein A3F61_01615 [Candidatus Blackburnbacteria bacterium RIFCSPHIGHO2_12_FULL_41_13b]